MKFSELFLLGTGKRTLDRQCYAEKEEADLKCSLVRKVVLKPQGFRGQDECLDLSSKTLIPKSMTCLK